MAEWFRTIAELSPWIYAPVLSIFWVALAFLVKKLLIKKLLRITERTHIKVDDLLIRSFSRPLDLVILASGVLLVSRLLPLESQMLKFFLIAFQSMIVMSGVWFLDQFLRNLIVSYSYTFQSAISPRVAQVTARVFLFSIGALIFLDLMGISITPVLASLGIGSLAVGLALQDTLSNFFSGIHLSIDKPIRLGDLVKLESGEEGVVTEIGWRSTRIRTGPNNLVVIPNNKLTGSVITNYFLPDREVAVQVQVGVHYDSDLAYVEKVTLEVAREVLNRVSSGISGFEPAVRFHTFDASSINLTVTLRAKEFGDQPVVKHEFIKALHTRYQKEGIVIPFPIQTVELSKDTIDSLRGVGKI